MRALSLCLFHAHGKKKGKAGTLPRSSPLSILPSVPLFFFFFFFFFFFSNSHPLYLKTNSAHRLLSSQTVLAVLCYIPCSLIRTHQRPCTHYFSSSVVSSLRLPTHLLPSFTKASQNTIHPSILSTSLKTLTTTKSPPKQLLLFSSYLSPLPYTYTRPHLHAHKTSFTITTRQTDPPTYILTHFPSHLISSHLIPSHLSTKLPSFLPSFLPSPFFSG